MTDPIVVDASVVVTATIDAGQAGEKARGVLRGRRRYAPFLIDAEVGNVLRRMTLSGDLDKEQATRTRRLAEHLVHRRVPHGGGIAERAWALRHNLTFYDALYVAVAESLGYDLVTTDIRIGGALPDHTLVKTLAD